jgi:transposase-like protein
MLPLSQFRERFAAHLCGTTQARGYLPEVKQQIINMAVNGSGMRDPAGVLKISRNTVTQEFLQLEFCFGDSS